MPTKTIPLPLVERLWTVSELVAETGVSDATWRREIRAERLTITDPGDGSERRSIRIADSEVRRWLASRTTARRTA